MARQLCIRFPGTVYHITNRVNAKQDTFIDNTVQKALLKVLTQIVEYFNWLCHACNLLDKHYHYQWKRLISLYQRGCVKSTGFIPTSSSTIGISKPGIFSRVVPGCFGRRCWIAKRNPVFI